MPSEQAMIDLRRALDGCRERAAAYLDAQAVVTGDALYWRHSPAHDPHVQPGHLLYGTWAGVMASVVIGADRRWSPDHRRRIANALNGFQREDGTFWLPGIPDSARQGHDDEYLALHCSNYALGALYALGQTARHQLVFMDPFMSDDQLDAWLRTRDWSRPWTEGNKIVNMVSFYALRDARGDARARDRLVQMANWLDVQQHAGTGFWQRDAGNDSARLVEAMAGAAHVFHLYYVLDRTIPRADRIIDSCLRLSYQGVRGACVDIDMVDTITHLRRYEHRRQEIDAVLERYLVELLQVQNRDGGFCDNYVTPHRLYGQDTPAGCSVTWTTWFRLATIGMAASALLPDQRGRWVFRNTPGSGYCNLEYATRDVPGASTFGMYCRPRRRMLLAAVRTGRFARQRVTYSARTLLSGGR